MIKDEGRHNILSFTQNRHPALARGNYYEKNNLATPVRNEFHISHLSLSHLSFL